ncbi:ribosome maturation factor RimP [Ornithinimicrobium sp. Y1694]|uniref:ribosome maturation factor RimP n=1 Tax=Ornithinimicrobium sp. Y1694 TaxID=3418590 RepID=UPI003CFA3B56
MDARERTEKITATVDSALAGSGVVVDDVSVQQAGKRRLVRVFLARGLQDLAPEDDSSRIAPLSLDEIAEATRTVSDALDGDDVMGEAPYTLEVSSAGLDRPLSTPDQFRRNVGRLLKVTPSGGSDVGTTTGRLVRSHADGIQLEVTSGKGAATSTVDLPWSAVEKAAVQVEFNRPESDSASGSDTEGKDS